MKILVTATIIALLSISAWGASFNSGEQLLAKCQSGESPYVIWCTGYLQGMADADDARVTSGDIKREICIAKDKVSNKQLRSSVIEYLKKHPEFFVASSPKTAQACTKRLKSELAVLKCS